MARTYLAKRTPRQSRQNPNRRLRAVLFVDYENAYRRAADLFLPGSDDKRKGHFHPWKLAEIICEKHNRDSNQPALLDLIQVRVYWGGFPWTKQSRKQRQKQLERFDVWRNPPPELNIQAADVDVKVIDPSRQLPGKWYPTDRERKGPVEKEVDVQITTDMLAMARAGEFDVAILFSEDSDQLPLVCTMLDESQASGVPQIHLAGWALTKKEWQRYKANAQHQKKSQLPEKPDSILRVPRDRLSPGIERPHVHRILSREYRPSADRSSYRIPQEVLPNLEYLCEQGDLVRVRGVGIGAHEDRLYVEIEGMDAPGMRSFVPRRELTERESIKLADYVGRSFEAKVYGVYPETGRVELSERSAARVKLIDSLREGESRKGRITDIRPFGVFVDLGGVDGLARISELSWERNVDPEQMFTIGQQVNVYITKIDKESKKIGLSIRRASLEERGSRRRAGTIRNTQRTGTEEVRPAEAGTNQRAHSYTHGEFVPAIVTRVLPDVVKVQTICGDEGEVEDRDLVPGKKPSDIVAKGDILPLVVRARLRRPLGLKLVEAHSEEGQKAKDDGWKFNTDGSAVPPADVAEQFQDQHD